MLKAESETNEIQGHGALSLEEALLAKQMEKMGVLMESSDSPTHTTMNINLGRGKRLQKNKPARPPHISASLLERANGLQDEIQLMKELVGQLVFSKQTQGFGCP